MEQKQEYDEHFKIILLGENAVGKSCLMHTYCGGTLYPFNDYMDTMGVDQKIQWINAFNKKINLRIWDASGAPRIQKIVESYFRHVDGALICFDLTNKTSLWHVKEHVDRLRAVKENIPMMLVGCKADLGQRREISSTQAKALADELGLAYFEVSALKKENVDQPFTQIIFEIHLCKQLHRIKPTLEEYFNSYLKLTHPKNRTHLFTEQNLSLAKEGVLREEYKIILDQLFDSSSVEELGAFCRTVLALIAKADCLYEQDNPFMSSFLTSPLSKTLKQSFDVVSGVLGDMMGLTAAKELIYQKKSTELTL